MPFYLVLTPSVGDEARLVADSPRGPHLLLDCGRAQFAVQVNPNDPGGAELAAVFARNLATEAFRFAKRCDDLASEAVGGVAQSALNR